MLGTLRPAVVGLIAPAAVSITLLALWGEGGFSPRVVDLNLISFFIFLVSFFILRKYKVNPILVSSARGRWRGLLSVIAKGTPERRSLFYCDLYFPGVVPVCFLKARMNAAAFS